MNRPHKYKRKHELRRVGENLYRNGHGQFFAWIFRAGKQVKRKLKTTDLVIAKNRLTELFTKMDSLADDRTIRFDELAEKWLETRRVNLKTSTWERCRCSVKAILPFFKGELVRSITLARIEEWSIRRAKELGPATYNKELETLKLIFRYAEDHGIILQNPAQKMKRRKLKKVKHVIPNFAQFRTLVAHLKTQTRTIKAGDFVEFLAYSGMRLDEARNVRRQHINWKRNILKVTGGAEGTKNGDEREIPIFPSLKTFLASYLDRMEDKSPEALLFPSRGPRKLADGRKAKKPPVFSAKHSIESACDQLRFPSYSHHDFRHFFCSNAIEKGIDFKVIAGWLGHKDGGVLVATTYGHLRAEHSAEMALRMSFDEPTTPLPPNVIPLNSVGITSPVPEDPSSKLTVTS